jgi:uncharacterized OB-fold protein
MAKTEYRKGIICKKCNSIFLPPFGNHLCQNCGTEIVKGWNEKDGFIILPTAEIIAVKVTHKFFNRCIYERVN